MAEHRALIATGIAASICVGLVATVVVTPLPRLVWNASASAPLGLYGVTPGAEVRAGDMVIARLPATFRALAARRHYLPPGVPLVKRVAAGPGARVCALDGAISVDGKGLARQRERDRAGRVMPKWVGCRTLGAGEYLLLMADVRDSFDGRYFGVTAERDLIGKALPIWVR